MAYVEVTWRIFHIRFNVLAISNVANGLDENEFLRILWLACGKSFSSKFDILSSYNATKNI